MIIQNDDVTPNTIDIHKPGRVYLEIYPQSIESTTMTKSFSNAIPPSYCYHLQKKDVSFLPVVSNRHSAGRWSDNMFSNLPTYTCPCDLNQGTR